MSKIHVFATGSNRPNLVAHCILVPVTMFPHWRKLLRSPGPSTHTPAIRSLDAQRSSRTTVVPNEPSPISEHLHSPAAVPLTGGSVFQADAIGCLRFL